MRVLVRRGHSLINDLRFSSGPIYVGRQPRCQVFLPDQSVSRQHAVLYTGNDGAWMVQDLESANRTLVNNRPVSKMPIHEGDLISICDFTLEVHFDQQAVTHAQEHPVDLNETIMGAPTAHAGIYHTTLSGAPPIRLAPSRIKDFYYFNVALCHLSDESVLISELCKKLLEQFDAYHVWGGLRETTSGPLTCHGGLTRSGQPVVMNQLAGVKIIQKSIQEESYVLLPTISDLVDASDTKPPGLEQLCSAMAAPIAAPAGAYGVIYIDNGVDQKPYTRQDLDYLILISTQIAAFVEHIG